MRWPQDKRLCARSRVCIGENKRGTRMFVCACVHACMRVCVHACMHACVRAAICTKLSKSATSARSSGTICMDARVEKTELLGVSVPRRCATLAMLARAFPLAVERRRSMGSTSRTSISGTNQLCLSFIIARTAFERILLWHAAAGVWDERTLDASKLPIKVA